MSCALREGRIYALADEEACVSCERDAYMHWQMRRHECLMSCERDAYMHWQMRRHECLARGTHICIGR